MLQVRSSISTEGKKSMLHQVTGVFQKGGTIAIRYLIPLQAVVLLVWWLYLAATEYAPDTWYDPVRLLQCDDVSCTMGYSDHSHALGE